MLTLAAWYIPVMAISFLLICVFMILVILIQKPRGGGLSGAFGGGGGSDQAAFGAKTGDVLTWFTVFCFVAFLLLAAGLTWAIKSKITLPPTLTTPQTTESQPAPSANNTPTTPPSENTSTETGQKSPVNPQSRNTDEQ